MPTAPTQAARTAAIARLREYVQDPDRVILHLADLTVLLNPNAQAVALAAENERLRAELTETRERLHRRIRLPGSSVRMVAVIVGRLLSGESPEDVAADYDYEDEDDPLTAEDFAEAMRAIDDLRAKATSSAPDTINDRDPNLEEVRFLPTPEDIAADLDSVKDWGWLQIPRVDAMRLFLALTKARGGVIDDPPIITDATVRCAAIKLSNLVDEVAQLRAEVARYEGMGADRLLDGYRRVLAALNEVRACNDSMLWGRDAARIIREHPELVRQICDFRLSAQSKEAECDELRAKLIERQEAMLRPLVDALSCLPTEVFTDSWCQLTHVERAVWVCEHFNRGPA